MSAPGDQKQASSEETIRRATPIVLAGDIGGTNTRLALYAVAPGSAARLLFDRVYPSKAHPSLDDIVEIFLAPIKPVRPGLTPVERSAFTAASPG
jgi:glucokinase